MERRRVKRTQGNKHISLAAIKQYLIYGTYPSGSTPSDKRSVRKRAESFKIEDGELYYIVRPKHIEGEPIDKNPGSSKANLRKAIISPKNQLSIAAAVHIQGGGAHKGTERTFSALSSKYYWVGMANTVRKVLKNCVICLANRPAVAKLPVTAPLTSTFIQEGDGEDLAEESSSELLAEREEAFTVVSSEGAKVDGNPADMKFVITSELTEPEHVDSDLDFDPETVVNEAIFNHKSDFDVAHRFWQKVEIQILGSFLNKKRSTYIITSLDCFSKWPEACKIDKVNEKTVAQFCLKLIARFGMMEQLVLLENDVTKANNLDSASIGINLNAYSLNISKENVNPLDESWNRLAVNLNRFVSRYPDIWTECLDFCLLPLRNSLVRNTDFTPSFLLMNREPSFPESVLPGKRSSDVEIDLNQDQIEHSVDAVMTQYKLCSLADLKQTSALVKESSYDECSDKVQPRRSYRKSKHIRSPKGGYSSVDEDLETLDNVLSSDESAAKKTKKFEAANKKKTEKSNGDIVNLTDSLNGNNNFIENGPFEESLEKIDLDTYYGSICLYLKNSTFPDSCTPAFKKIIKESSSNYIICNGSLMCRQKGKLRKVLTRTIERLELLKESHVKNGEHLSKAKVQEIIESKEVFWKDLALDVRAFVSACPGCRFGEVRRKRKASKKFVRWYKVAEGEEDSDTESIVAGDLGKVSNDELVDYLKQDITPNNLSRSELLIFKKKAKNFKMDKGTLLFWPTKKADMKPRKVIRSANERKEIISKIHGGDHLEKSVMLEMLKRQYFWQSMSQDVDDCIRDCCQPAPAHDPNDDDNDACDPVFESKVKFYQDYFAGKDLCLQQKSVEEPAKGEEPAKDSTVDKPRQDLVAAAMESAQLTSHNISAEDHWELPCEAVAEDDVPLTSANPLANEDTNGTVSIYNHGMSHSVLAQMDMKAENMKMNGSKDENTVESSENQDKPMMAFKLLKKAGNIRKSHVRRRCEVCQEVIKGDNNYKEHMYKHTKVKPFSCHLCNKKLTSIKGLNMHARRHTGHRPYLCNICGRGFPRSASLRYHIKTHEKGGGVPAQCDICSRTFSTENRMLKHKRFKHPAQAPVFKCDQCGKVFTAKRSLKRHEEAHQGIRKFECQYCKRCFFRKEYLNYHLVSHANEDPSLASFRNKGKFKRAAQKKRELPSELSIVCLDPSTIEVAHDQEVYSQLVDDPNHHEWTDIHGDRSIVYGLEGSQRVEEVDPDGATTLVMMEEHPDAHGNLEVRHIILPREHLKPGQITLHSDQQVQPQLHQITLPSGTHTFTLPSGSHLQALDSSQETVQYQVECIPGDTLTEADINAIRMLAQASLSGTHILQ